MIARSRSHSQHMRAPLRSIGTRSERACRMAILCGTDFSEPAHEALIVAAHLAVRMQRPLHLVNSAALGSESGAAETSEFLDWTLRRLHLTADQARALGAEVFVHLKRGAPDETLLELARDL